MNNLHEQEKEQFKRLFHHLDVDNFDLRFQVLEAFLKLEHHVNINDIMEQLEKDGGKLDANLVSSTMATLCRFGFASKREFDDGQIWFEHKHLGLHHDHMICTKCGIILEFRDEKIEDQQLKLAATYDFHMLQHKMEIYGICAKCMEIRSEIVYLSKAKTGEKLIIKEFKSGPNMVFRLASLGLRRGDEIEVVSTGFSGQIVVATGNDRLAIGKEMANKILVQPQVHVKIDRKTIYGKAQIKDIVPIKMLMTQMKEGQQGFIQKVNAIGVLKRRLLEMGINRGSLVYVEKYAPFKDPMEIVVKDYHLSLRCEEAENIVVEDVRYVKAVR